MTEPLYLLISAKKKEVILTTLKVNSNIAVCVKTFNLKSEWPNQVRWAIHIAIFYKPTSIFIL